jgi:hypothetical protein
LQFVTWNQLDRYELAPSTPVTVPVTLIGLQLVGLNVKPGPLIPTLIVLMSVGTPSMIVGNGSEAVGRLRGMRIDIGLRENDLNAITSGGLAVGDRAYAETI